MPSLKRQVKMETRVDKIRNGRLKSTELSSRGREQDVAGATLTRNLSESQSRRVVQTSSCQSGLTATKLAFVPVINTNNKPLMPTRPSRAKRWIKSRKATPFWKKGVFCVRLNVKPSNDKKQEIVVGIDPGSKREAFTVKSESHTYLNILTETPDWVKNAVKTRREMRQGRRFRKTPCRKNRQNRSRGGLAPSTKARWQWKLRVLNWLSGIFPISHVIVEDIKARTMGKKKWDSSFSPLEVGKKWFYDEIGKTFQLSTRHGWETKELRDSAGLKKSNSKLDDKFECHNIDSWVLANEIVGGHVVPENTSLIKIVPLRFHRRQLHVFQPSRGGKRKKYGGTRSLGFKRGSLVRHKKHGLVYVGGTSKGCVSLHDCVSGKRLSQKAKKEDCEFKIFLSFRSKGVELVFLCQDCVCEANV